MCCGEALLNDYCGHALIEGGKVISQPSTKGIIVRVWINFTELRKQLRFEDVLRHYGVEVRRKGDQHTGPCPLPAHKGSKTAPCFSANLERGIFQCFHCKASGNLLEFAALMAQVDPEDGRALRKVAVELQTRFAPEGANTKTARRKARELPAPPPASFVNPPLDFALKGLDASHPFFEESRLSQETVAVFGLGACSRGLLADRVAIPLHDAAGNRVGYAGLSLDESEPRYLFPEDRERNGSKLLFRKDRLLYNAHRIKAPCDDLVIVEEIESVWWLHQCGFEHVVATMGSGCSKEQAELAILLLHPSGKLWVMPSGTDAGLSFGRAVVEHVAKHRFVRLLCLGLDRKPTDFPREVLAKCFA